MIRKMKNSDAPPLPLLVILVCAMVFNPSVFAAQDISIRIVVVAGNGAQNTVNQIPPEPLGIRVVDRENRPVRGAVVTFTAPPAGATGEFPTGPSFMTITDEDGRALGVLYRPNSVEGSYHIQVRAEYLGEVSTAEIRQSNILGRRPGKRKLLTVLAIAGAGAGTAFVASGRGNGNGSMNSSPNPTSTSPTPTIPIITFGGSSIGGR